MRNDKYLNIQVMRAIAAMLVVWSHATVAVIQWHFCVPPPGTDWGAAGVDVFFPVSGFIMVITTKNMWGDRAAWRSFMRKRIIRVVPLYWLFTAAKVAILLSVPQVAFHKGELNVEFILMSLLFIPAINPATGGTHPLLAVGWTLSFEMLFYVIFASLLWTRHPVRWILGILAAMAMVGAFRGDWGAVATLLDPMLLEFAFGMLVAVAVLNGKLIPGWLALPALACLGFAPMVPDFSTWRVVLWGIPGAISVWAAASATLRPPAWLVSLGDASYSIYLSHGFVVPVIVMIAPALKATAYVPFVGLSLVASAIVGVAAFRYLETPLIRLFRAPRPAQPIADGAT